MRLKKKCIKKIFATILTLVMVVSLFVETSITSRAEENVSDASNSYSVAEEDVSDKNDETEDVDIIVPEEDEDGIVKDNNTEENEADEADKVENTAPKENKTDVAENDITEESGAALAGSAKVAEASVPAAISEETQEELPHGDCGINGDNLTWRLEKKSEDTYILVIEGSGEMAEYFLNRTPWTEYIQKVVEISLPDRLKNIGSFAFASASISYIDIPDSVKSIGKSAFYRSSLKEIVIPENVSLGISAFSSCGALTKVKIGEGCTTIEQTTFTGCTKLKEIEIPVSVTGIGKRAFYNCKALETVYYKGTEAEWNTLLQNTDTSTSTSNTYLINCKNVIYGTDMPETTYSITISDKLNGTVKVDKTSASRGETVTVSQTPDEGYNFIGWVIRDPASTEELCSVTGNKFIMPGQDVQVVAWYVSNKCGTTWDGADGSNLTWRVSENKDGETYTLIIEGSGTMGGYDRGKSTPWYMYQDKITAISLPDGLLNIGSGAFEGTKISKIKIPDSVKNIAHNSFLSSIYLTEIELPENAVVGDFAFAYSALRSVKVPANAMSEYYRTDSAKAFYASALLEKAELCEGITYIPEQYFGKCSSLKEIIIPASVTSIDKLAFGDCDSLETVYYGGTKEQWEELKKNTIMGLFDNGTYKTDNQNLFNAKKIVFNYIADNGNNGNNGGNNTSNNNQNNTQTSTGQKGNGGAKGSAAGKAGNTAAGGNAAQAGAAARTGDTAQVGVLFGLLLVSGAVLLCITIRRRAKRS